jgi:hypothetical protein
MKPTTHWLLDSHINSKDGKAGGFQVLSSMSGWQFSVHLLKGGNDPDSEEGCGQTRVILLFFFFLP